MVGLFLMRTGIYKSIVVAFCSNTKKLDNVVDSIPLPLCFFLCFFSGHGYNHKAQYSPSKEPQEHTHKTYT